MNAFNRTLFLYEVEWHWNGELDILLLVVENIQYPLVFIGDIAPYFNQLYSVQCLIQSKSSVGRFRHLNMHEFDRTVIIKCTNVTLDETQNISLTLQFVELKTKTIISTEIHLCSSLFRPVTVGHCHKALFDDIPFYLIQQWLDYHIYIGVQRFHIYDRTLKYESLLKSYIDRGYVVYIPFPLLQQIEKRERFNWIDQFVGKIHCLMQTRRSFDWLGTWDFDEYLHFFTSQSVTPFLPDCLPNQACKSMLSQYLIQNFAIYGNVILPAVNYIGDGNISVEAIRTTDTLVLQQYQERSMVWNDRLKYIIQPKQIDYLNIHFAVTLPEVGTYESRQSSPDIINMTEPRSWIRLNHYPSARYVRDEIFLALQSGSNRTVHDPSLLQIFTQLKIMDRNRTLAERIGVFV